MRTWIRALTTAVVAALALSGLAAAQAKPDLNGTWKMNRAKSKFQAGGPEAISIKFEQQGEKLSEVLTITGSEGDRVFNLSYTLDGKETTTELRGEPFKSTAKWEGNTLVIEVKGGPGALLRKFTFSEDGKTMTAAVQQPRPDGEINDVIVFEKQ